MMGVFFDYERAFAVFPRFLWMGFGFFFAAMDLLRDT